MAITSIGRNAGRLLAIVLLPWLSMLTTARAEHLNIAVAANFLGTAQRLADRYQQTTQQAIDLSSASSGQLYAQVQQGAPFDALLSADVERPQQLVAAGLAVADSRFTYATGRLALWGVSKPEALLRSGNFKFLAIADPAQAPYGKAARQVLEHLGLARQLDSNHQLVLGSSIAQVWQFVHAGSVDLAFVAWSQALNDSRTAAGKPEYWMPPQDLYDPLRQDAVLLTKAPHAQAAAAFLKWLQFNPDARHIIAEDGYLAGP